MNGKIFLKKSGIIRAITSAVPVLILLMTHAPAFAADTPANPTAKGGYTLDFSDEFNGTTLNTSTWLPYYLPHWSTRTLSAAHYNVSNGALNLQLVSGQKPWCPTYDPGVKVSSICTYEKNYLHRFAGTNMALNHSESEFNGYTTKYGYFEIRAKGPSCGGGGHCAWWMIGCQDDQDSNGLNYTQSAEIDCTENLFSNMNSWSPKIHPWSDNNIVNTTFNITTAGNAANEYHIYAIDWTPNGVGYYFDNKMYAFTTSSPSYRMMTMFSIYTSDNMWSGNDNGVYPKTWSIDYFRVWKSNAGYTSTPSYYYLINRNNGQLLNMENSTGKVECTAGSENWWTAQWLLEYHDGYTRFKNRQTGYYMNEEHMYGYEEYSNLGNPNWWSCDYSQVTNGSYIRLQNRYTGKIVNNENNLGYAQSTASLPTSYWSGDWILVPAYN